MRIVAHVSALRPLKDSVNWSAIPVGTPLVAGYVPPSHFAWPQAAWDRFAGSIEVRITPTASVHGAGIQVLDVETGDATPAQVPGWVSASRADGQEPTVYCNHTVWAAVIRACTGAGVAVPHFWIADWNDLQDLPTTVVDGVSYTAVAHQYADPATSGGDWDSSVVADAWPGVDQGETDVANTIMQLTEDQANGRLYAVLTEGSNSGYFAAGWLSLSALYGGQEGVSGVRVTYLGDDGTYLGGGTADVAWNKRWFQQLPDGVGIVTVDFTPTTDGTILVGAIELAGK